jgi:hypothetical protein
MSELRRLNARWAALDGRLGTLETRVADLDTRTREVANVREDGLRDTVERTVGAHMQHLQNEMTRNFKSDVDILQTKIEHTVNSKISEALIARSEDDDDTSPLVTPSTP